MREVKKCRITVPPSAGLWTFLDFIFPFSRCSGRRLVQKSALHRISAHVVRIAPPGDAPERRKIHAYIWTHPKHHLISHRMKLVNHPLRIREARRLEPPVPVSGLPRIVNHENAGRDTARQHRLGVGKNVLLVLTISKLNPSIELRRGEEKRVRRISGRSEIFPHCMAVGSGKRFLGGRFNNDRRIGIHRNLSAFDGYERLLLRPDDASMVRNHE